MAAGKQKQVARCSIARARQVQCAQAHGRNVAGGGAGMGTAEGDCLADRVFAFPEGARGAADRCRARAERDRLFRLGGRRRWRGRGGGVLAAAEHHGETGPAAASGRSPPCRLLPGRSAVW